MNPKLKRIVTALKPRNRIQELLDDMDQVYRNAPKIVKSELKCYDCGSTNAGFVLTVELPGEDNNGIYG